MLYLVDRCTPEDAPTMRRVEPIAPLGMYLGRPLSPRLGEVMVQMGSLRNLFDMWWVGPYFLVSAPVLQMIRASEETHFEIFPVALTARQKVLRDAMFVLNLLDNVPCLDRHHSRFSVDVRGMISRVSHLVLDEERIPEDRSLFQIAEAADLVVARQGLVERLQQSRVRGVRFLPVETSSPGRSGPIPS